MGRFTTEQVEAGIDAYLDRTEDAPNTPVATEEVFVDPIAVRTMLLDKFPHIDGESLGMLVIGMAIGADLRAAPEMREVA